MHGSQSRARILFEAFCALAIAASFAAAWMQTGASALLAAAAVAALFGMIHAFDRRASHQAEVPNPEPQLIAPLSDAPQARPAPEESAPAETMELEEAVAVAPAPSKPPRKSRAKTRRKSSDVRDSTTEGTNVTEIGRPKEAEIAAPEPLVEATHPPIEPLFEPEPFVRMPRPAFGRKAG